jgi:endonuclease/exonuclease/phosphatase family metal-dependent hydrolase
MGFSLKSIFILTLTVSTVLPRNLSQRRLEDMEGSFTILSYNVGGLPEIISSSKPSKYTKQISPKLNDYDIINVQEDFGYNDDLTSQLKLPFRTKFTGNVPFGNGLMTFSKFPLYMTSNEKWKDTHGFIEDGADEMIPKGFCYSSVEIKPGYFIDIYNIHTDADTDEQSMAARRSNMAQLSEYIDNISAGKAVIVFGDTNSRYTRKGDDFYELLLKPRGLKDAWIQNVMDGVIPPIGDSLMVNDLGEKGEVVDKIFFRSGKNVQINASTFKLLLTEFTDSEGNQLSDHYPITSRIDYKLLDNIQTSDTFGGTGGTGFSFVDKVGGKYPRSVTISTGERVDRVGFTYFEHGLVTAGGNGGSDQIYVFRNGEYLSSMTVCQDQKSALGTYRVSYISLTTNLGESISGGKCKKDSVTFTPPKGYAIAGFIGKAAEEIDRLGCVYQKI